MNEKRLKKASWYDEQRYAQLLCGQLLDKFGSKAFSSPVQGGYYAKLEQYADGTASLSWYCGNLVGVSKATDPRKATALDYIQKTDKGTIKRKKAVLGEIRADSLSRTRHTLERLVRNNLKQFKSFVTLTFDPSTCQGVDIYNNAERYFNLWNKKIKQWATRQGVEVLYVGVPEFQKNGRVHYHFLTNFTVKNGLLTPQADRKGCYDVRGWSYGFSSAFLLNDVDAKFDCVKYMMKYMFKDMDNRLFGHRKIKQCGLDTTRHLVFFGNTDFSVLKKWLGLFYRPVNMWGAVNQNTGEAYYFNYTFSMLGT